MNFWVDIDNAPHVPVLRPIINWLQDKGHRVDITARDYGQALPLLEFYNMPYRKVGRHPGANRARKVLSLVARNAALIPVARRNGYAAAFTHGSRGPFLPCRLTGVPQIQMGDYEHGVLAPFMYRWPAMFLIPDVIPAEIFTSRGVEPSRIRQFPGLKEELYVYDEMPNDRFLDDLGVDRDKIIVLVRPPASMAHYHVAEGDRLFVQIMKFLRDRTDVAVILIPRTKPQRSQLTELLRELNVPNVVIPDRVYRGAELIYHSDLVLSGGGTMNREAACLGVPVYSIFRGPQGAVDRDLMAKGRLHQIIGEDDLDQISFSKTAKPNPTENLPRKERLLNFIGNAILEVGERRIQQS